MEGKGERGFLLMELLVSLALLAIVASPLLAAVAVGAETQARARRHTAAVYLARQVMETARGQGYCQVTEQSNQPVAGYSGFTCDVAVAEPLNWSGFALKEIRVTVAWREREVWQQVGLVTYLARR